MSNNVLLFKEHAQLTYQKDICLAQITTSPFEASKLTALTCKGLLVSTTGSHLEHILCWREPKGRAMASLRKSKALSPDGQTARFLYTILKQLDMKTVDWNLIADGLDIT